VLVFYHFVRPFAPAHMRQEPQGRDRSYEGGALISTGAVETPEGEESPFRETLGDDRR